jgi:type II secretory pathway pseudopilin PulG
VDIRKVHGFALIDVLFVCGVIGILASIAMPQLMTAKQSAASASAVASMRTINSSQLTYALTCAAGFYAPDLTVLGTPPPASSEPFIAAGLGVAAVVEKSSYVIQMTATPFAGAPPSCNGAAAGADGQAFVAAADPKTALNPRFFATNANNVIWEHTATLWGVMPEVGEPAVGHMVR